MESYKLRAQCQGHSGDVRSVDVQRLGNDESFASGSRDKYMRIWKLGDNSINRIFQSELHQKYIGAVVWTSSENVATACQDGFVRIFTHSEEMPFQSFKAHSENVSCIEYSATNKLLITGSWDKTAKVWEENQCIYELKGHSAAVWCVAVVEDVDSMYVLTGSADKKIFLWKKDCCVQKYEGHTDAVRSLLVLSSNEFLSASNDASIKHWSIKGDCIATYYSHENYIYSLTQLSNGFASCGEDRSVRIWQFQRKDLKRQAECIQIIRHPAISVWTVGAFSNDDIVTGSSDGILRIFSKDVSRQAAEDVQMAFQDEVIKVEVAVQQQNDEIDIKNLPGPESLLEPGTRDSQFKIINENNERICYSWSASKQEWEKIGNVVGVNDKNKQCSSGKEYMGKRYDFVFDVDVQEGLPPIQLPFNEGDDPYMAAQKFLTENELSQHFLDEVANFIIKNSNWNATKLQSSSSSSYVDPFTGAGRYVPSGNAATTTSASKYFPQTNPVRIEQANIKGIVAKLKDFNAKLPSELSVTSDALDSLEGLMLGTSETNADRLLAILATTMHWPNEYIFPVLDLLRLAVIEENFTQKLVDTLTPLGLIELLKKYFIPSAGVVNVMLSTRIIANLLTSTIGKKIILPEVDTILLTVIDIIENCKNSSDSQRKQLNIALSTVLLNISVLNMQHDFSMETKASMLDIIRSLLENCSDQESQFRILVALGTMLQEGRMKLVALSLEFTPLLNNLKKVTDPEKLGHCAEDLLKALGV
ncbi:phospholipase A-2-activating protein-like [Artemia franciscana]|uniref:Phospholipase A-2-activating protein n=1 Tax=Artemia franciscana TaxID=6661 RepID=A0AA88I5Y9_ARTSF|nr:hypothetical protein QYM36_002830 [Artemia franciscana]